MSDREKMTLYQLEDQLIKCWQQRKIEKIYQTGVLKFWNTLPQSSVKTYIQKQIDRLSIHQEKYQSIQRYMIQRKKLLTKIQSLMNLKEAESYISDIFQIIRKLRNINLFVVQSVMEISERMKKSGDDKFEEACFGFCGLFIELEKNSRFFTNSMLKNYVTFISSNDLFFLYKERKKSDNLLVPSSPKVDLNVTQTDRLIKAKKFIQANLKFCQKYIELDDDKEEQNSQILTSKKRNQAQTPKEFQKNVKLPKISSASQQKKPSNRLKIKAERELSPLQTLSKEAQIKPGNIFMKRRTKTISQDEYLNANNSCQDQDLNKYFLKNNLSQKKRKFTNYSKYNTEQKGLLGKIKNKNNSKPSTRIECCSSPIKNLIQKQKVENTETLSFKEQLNHIKKDIQPQNSPFVGNSVPHNKKLKLGKIRRRKKLKQEEISKILTLQNEQIEQNQNTPVKEYFRTPLRRILFKKSESKETRQIYSPQNKSSLKFEQIQKQNNKEEALERRKSSQQCNHFLEKQASKQIGNSSQKQAIHQYAQNSIKSRQESQKQFTSQKQNSSQTKQGPLRNEYHQSTQNTLKSTSVFEPPFNSHLDKKPIQQKHYKKENQEDTTAENIFEISKNLENPKLQQQQSLFLNSQRVNERKKSYQATVSKQEIKLKPKKLNIDEFMSYSHNHFVKGTKKIQNHQYIKKISQTKNIYLTQFYYKQELAVFGICSPYGLENYLITDWCMIEGKCTNKMSITLFRKYLSYIERFSTCQKIYVMAEEVRGMREELELEKSSNEKVYEYSRKSEIEVEEAQVPNFFYMQLSNIKFDQLSQVKICTNSQIEVFNQQNSLINTRITTVQENSSLMRKRRATKHQIPSIKEVNKLLEKKHIDNYEIDSALPINNIDLGIIIEHLIFRENFICENNYFIVDALVHHQQDEEMVVQLGLKGEDRQIFVGTGLSQINKITSHINSQNKQKKKVCVKMFYKQLYGEIDHGCYGNWQLSLVWQNRLQGKVSYPISDLPKFGPSSYYLSMWEKSQHILTIKIAESDML